MTSTYIYNDKEFKIVVTNIANGSIDQDHQRFAQLRAAEYLWDSANWERLKETPHGQFLRECTYINECPDPALRAIYRQQVLEAKD